jgi:hypothetical protein
MGHNTVFDLYWDEVDSIAILVIKGTDNVLEWIVNASCYIHKFDDENYPGLFVHEGWHSTAEDIHRRVMNEMDGNDFPMNMKKLIITGHSLGGACAQILSKIFKLDVQIICCTFGAPTPFNCKEFPKGFDGDMYNYAFKSDPVPYCPYKLSDEKFRKALYTVLVNKVVPSSIVSTSAFFGLKIEDMIHKTIDFPLDITSLLINYKHVRYYSIDLDYKKKKQNDIIIDHHGMEFYVDNARTCKEVFFKDNYSMLF